MTLVRVKVSVPEVMGLEPAGGAIRWTPTKRRVAGDTVVMPKGFAVPLLNGAADIEVSATSADWVWRVDEQVPGATNKSLYLAVPDLAEIEYTDLIEVDPKTLVPTADPDPAWYAYVDTLAGQAGTAAASAVAAKTAAETARDSATGSQASAAASAATATTKATEAGASATNASQSAATALGHKDAAAGSAGAAANSATNASNSATSASGSATAAAGSANTASNMAGVAQSSASDTIAAANGFSIGTVTTGAPGDAATATISGSAPNKKLNLGLPKGDTGPANSLSVLGTATGPDVPGTPGAQGLKGDKGDPGPLSAPAWVGTVNLDVMTTSGFYQQVNGTYATLANNYPVALSGWLLVISRGAGDTVQEYTPQIHPTTGYRTKYIRSNAGSGWTPWKAWNTARVDQTAGRVIYQWDDVNNREQLIWGDTGWRGIALDATYGVVASGDNFIGANGNALAADAVKLRRVGNRVYIGGTSPLQPKADYSTATRTVCTLPTGFRSSGSNEFIVTRYGNNGGDSTQRLVMLNIGADYANPATVQAVPLIDANWNGFATGGTWPRLYGGIWLWGMWITNENWPTTLPGTAVGTIPNL